MAGAVLSALNFRLDETMLALILQQLEAKIILVDHQFVHIVLKALNILSQAAPNCKPPILVLIPECNCKTSSSSSSSSSSTSNMNGILNYNDLLEPRDHAFEIIRPTNECDPISVNYTSGSTGNPKGVIYSHRAVYLNSLAMIMNMGKRRVPVFLWTVDMFRCNGWCYTWAIAALGGTNVCLQNTNLSAKIILNAISLHNVTHLCGKPVILNLLAEASNGDHQPLESRVEIFVAGALPSHRVLNKVTEMGFDISHGYGMTEALGPAVIKPWIPNDQPEHSRVLVNGDDDRGDQEQVKNATKSRGENPRFHHNLMIMEGFDVKGSSTMESVPNDGKTMGEIMFRGNTLMSGYLKNSKATEEAFSGGWYRTGDVGIRHQDGSIQMKDRAQDIVLCGGNVISTLEVEAVLSSHPNVSEAAVVGRRDDCLGEIPCAFVKLKEGCESVTSSEEIIEFCGSNLPAYYMVPHAVIFGDLPVNSTGKVQKFVLRDKANATNGSCQPRYK